MIYKDTRVLTFLILGACLWELVSGNSHSLAALSVHVCSPYEIQRVLLYLKVTVLVFVWNKTLRFEEVNFLCASNVSM